MFTLWNKSAKQDKRKNSCSGLKEHQGTTFLKSEEINT